MESLQGKKLLFFGATAAMNDVILRAKELGIYTVVADYYKNSPGKKSADKSYDVSTLDLDAMRKIVKEEKVDGVFTGFSDANLIPCYTIAKEFNFPFYANPEQIENTTNKIEFKKMCRACNLPVVDEYSVTSYPTEENTTNIVYPIIIKPADSYASKGISVCQNLKEFQVAYDEAIKHSPTQTVIVERYIEGWDDSCMYLTIQNGNVTLSAMTDRDMNFSQKGKAQQPNALFYPSKYIDTYYDKYHKHICEMIDYLKIQNGTMFIQFFAKDDEFLIFETGYRLCGANEYIIVSSENEINSIDMHLRYALTGKFEGWDNTKFDNARFENKYAILVVLLKPGTITTIEGLDEIKNMKEVINMLQFVSEGDVLGKETEGSLTQTFARIYIKEKDQDSLMTAIKKVLSTLDVLDENGNSMIIEGIKY